MMSMLLAIITIGVSSCTEERFGSVVGCWELESDEYGYVEDVMVDKYYFYADGTGTYGYYDRDAYVRRKGMVSRIDEVERAIWVVKERVPFDMILDIQVEGMPSTQE